MKIGVLNITSDVFRGVLDGKLVDRGIDLDGYNLEVGHVSIVGAKWIMI